ncbi:uncharacterized protein METZ01_LOCUS290179, partial [marine metagenome]
MQSFREFETSPVTTLIYHCYCADI